METSPTADPAREPSAHSRRRFLIAAGSGVAVTAAGILLSTLPTGGPDSTPVDPDNPRGLAEYEPVYDRAVRGLEAPLGFDDCTNPTVRATRDMAGSDHHAVTPIIDRFVIHHTGTTSEQLDFLSRCNRRSSAPTFYLRHDGSVIELIRPGAKPSSTGADWNWRSLAVETLNATGAPDYAVTDAQLEGLAQMIAWLATFDGTTLDGVPVSFRIDREHVISHRETWSGTECPGPYLQSRLDDIVARARVLFDGGR
ncbi:peptidoglycan recognition family protein [Streptomyces sp. AC495_CC817]|uniref:peptidoglycan recognition protein family protein n=1 Tax=Streptomyces sp. AC495_CC817 TaxID=2823900 RepID=UPI001C275C01|nr:peptidoglycan recognition family protein [Streptomyces sp. AC495_CC817]